MGTFWKKFDGSTFDNNNPMSNMDVLRCQCKQLIGGTLSAGKRCATSKSASWWVLGERQSGQSAKSTDSVIPEDSGIGGDDNVPRGFSMTQIETTTSVVITPQSPRSLLPGMDQ